MTPLSKGPRFLWLVLFAVLFAFVGGRWSIPAAAWLAPAFALRFYRDSDKGGLALLWLWIAAAGAGVISGYQTTTLYFTSALIEAGLMVVMTLPLLIPFVIDRVFHRRWVGDGPGPFWLTLIYPISSTAIDVSSTIGSPLGSFGALAYSQAGWTAPMQLTAITGMAGLAFVISWFASTAAYAWEGGFEWRKIKAPVTLCAVALIAVFGFGFGRLALVEPPDQSVRIGGFSLPLAEAASMQALWRSGADQDYRDAFRALNRRQLAQVRLMAQEGAQIVVLQEVAVQGLEDEVTAMLIEAATLAREEGIYLVLPTALIVPDGQDRNAVHIIDPNGDIVLEHLKYGGAILEGSVAGSGVLQFVDTPYGRLSAIICWDADFPAIVRQAGAQDVDLLLNPSNDWFGIRNLHPAMATFRAVENGMPIFRQTGNGVSSVIDAYGRVIHRVDMYAEGADPNAWGGVQMVDVPIGAVPTLYPRIGDVFGWAMVAVLLGLLGGAWFWRGGAVRKPDRAL